jgi:hypothetical protein
VYLGGPTGLASESSYAWENVAENFGVSVASAGDVNGDGYADVVVGTRNGGGDGHAFVYLGGATGVGGEPSWTLSDGVYGSFFGGSVASAGDVNGDGYADVLVGTRSRGVERLCLLRKPKWPRRGPWHQNDRACSG